MSLSSAPKSLRIAVIYRPPGTSCSTFIDEFTTFPEDTALLITGDFDIHMDIPSQRYTIVQIIGLRMASRFANFYFMFAWCLDPWAGRRRPYFLGRFCKCRHPVIYVGNLQIQGHLSQLIKHSLKWRILYKLQKPKIQFQIKLLSFFFVEIQHHFTSLPGDQQVG